MYGRTSPKNSTTRRPSRSPAAGRSARPSGMRGEVLESAVRDHVHARGDDAELIDEPAAPGLGVHDHRVDRAQQPACRRARRGRTSRGSTSCAVSTTRPRERPQQAPVEDRDRQPLEVHDVGARRAAGGAPAAAMSSGCWSALAAALPGASAVEALGPPVALRRRAPRRTGNGLVRARRRGPGRASASHSAWS